MLFQYMCVYCEVAHNKLALLLDEKVSNKDSPRVSVLSRKSGGQGGATLHNDVLFPQQAI